MRTRPNHNLDNTIKNGFVSLTSFIKDGSTNININDHKQIEIYTLSETQLDIAIKLFTKKNLEKFSNLLSINNNIFHWHFRPSSSLNRTELIEKLKKQEFEYWEPNRIS